MPNETKEQTKLEKIEKHFKETAIPQYVIFGLYAGAVILGYVLLKNLFSGKREFKK